LNALRSTCRKKQGAAKDGGAKPAHGYPMPRSSTRSSGVPHFRQMIDAQSPHTSVSETGSRHRGQ